MNIEAYKGNPLATDIYHQVIGVDFGSEYRITPVVTEQLAAVVKKTCKGLDYRARVQAENGFGSVFDGLAFDPDQVRSQSFALYDIEADTPIGVMSSVIAPREWIAQQRYFERVENGVVVRDFQAITGKHLPDFLIVPAWTTVTEENRTKFAIPGFRAFTRVMYTIQQNAPENTWMEAIAQGRFPYDRSNELQRLAEIAVGTHIPTAELPFDLDLIGKPSDGAMSSAKMAPLMGLNQSPNLGSSKTLGPTFSKQVR